MKEKGGSKWWKKRKSGLRIKNGIKKEKENKERRGTKNE